MRRRRYWRRRRRAWSAGSRRVLRASRKSSYTPPARPKLTSRLFNLLADLDDPRFSQASLHRALEALDARGVRPVREHQTPERLLGWIDGEFGGAWSSEAAAGGIWFADDADGPLGFAAFGAHGLAYRWLRPWQAKAHVGLFGPFGIVERARGSGLGATLLHGALFALRERGYRQALIPAVGGERLV